MSVCCRTSVSHIHYSIINLTYIFTQAGMCTYTISSMSSNIKSGHLPIISRVSGLLPVLQQARRLRAGHMSTCLGRILLHPWRVLLRSEKRPVVPHETISWRP